MDAPAEWNNMERWSGVRRAGAAFAVVLMAGALALVVFQDHAAASQPVALESAILPPAAFRRWVYGATHQDAPRNEIPLDRLAGRGRGAAVPTEVPGYYEKELKAAKQKYFEVHNEVAPKLVEVQENILKKGETPELLQEEADLKEVLSPLTPRRLAKYASDLSKLISQSVHPPRPVQSSTCHLEDYLMGHIRTQRPSALVCLGALSLQSQPTPAAGLDRRQEAVERGAAQDQPTE